MNSSSKSWTSGLLLLLQLAAAQTTTPAPGKDAITAVSECHLHSSTQYCMAGTAEYRVVATATPTGPLPSSYTGCHGHGTDLYCISPKGDEVEIVAAHGSEDHDHEEESNCHSHDGVEHCHDSEDEHHDHDHDHEDHEHHGEETAASTGRNCHFHAGVEHCVDENSASERRCDKVDRDYDVPLRVGLLFAMLVVGASGVFGPILLTSMTRLRPTGSVFMFLKQFGTGVIFSTAFVHLFTHASLMFNNECLGELSYEATTASIVMAGVFISFLVDYLGQRYIQWKNEGKAQTEGVISDPHHCPETLNVIILEAGIIFHSLLIGVTLVVAGDSFLITLFIVVLFHQFFEGLALGSRIAAIASSTLPGIPNTHAPLPLPRKLLMALAFALTTPIGMAIGIGVLNSFNGNDPATLIAIGTLDALSAGVLIWVGVVEMWAHDWVFGDMARAGPLHTGLGLGGLVSGMVLMNVLGKWA